MDTRQLSLFETQSAMRDAEERLLSAIEQIAAREAYDAWHADFFKRFYTAERAAAIMASGDGTRIRLYRTWQDKQRG